MNDEERENHLFRRISNYRWRQEQEKQTQTSCTINNHTRGPFQNLTNMNFPSSYFYGTHHNEVNPNILTYVDDVALGWWWKI